MKTLPAKQQVPYESKPFSWPARRNSFRYAFDGLRVLVRHEHNTWIHAGLTLAVLVLSFMIPVSRVEFILLLLVMTLVWTMEIINTAIEKAMDFISLEKHPQIKLVKDLAAAAVLVSAVAAFLIGTLIFLPKLVRYV